MNDIRNKFSEIVGENNFLDHLAASETYGTNTIGYSRDILGAIILEESSQIPKVLSVARQNNIKIYPISTGKNWGYGSSLPVSSGSIILDLSKLNRIIEFNSKLGYVVLEPGVTQQMLFEFIESNNLSYMVPTTGAGPDVSLLGNAIERGYGMTPIEDHTSSLISMRAYLPNGQLYESQLSEFGGYRSDSVFKWKIGPHLDGLFSQSNLGIVFQATLALAKKPENMTQFLSYIDEDNLENAIDTIRKIKIQIGSIAGGINIMNKRRLLAMINGAIDWPLNFAAPDSFIRELALQQKLPDWMILGGLYGPHEMVKGAIEVVSKELNEITNKTIFINRKKVQLFSRIVKYIPLSNMKRIVLSLEKAIDVLEGKPGQIALPLAYLKHPERNTFISQKNLSPDRDNCGLIWFSPLIPVDGNLARDYVSEIHRICLYYDIEPLITLTLISERCFDSTIPLLFNKNSSADKVRAQLCHDALVKIAPELGIFPYRLDVRSMEYLYRENHGVASRLWSTIKKAVDPENIISPGRYHKLDE